MDLGLIDDFNSLTKLEVLKYLKDLDIIHDPAEKISECLEKLKESWQQGREMLKANQGEIMMQLRLREIIKIQKIGEKKQLNLRTLRIIARKMGIFDTGTTRRAVIIKELDKIIKTKFNESITSLQTQKSY